MSPLRAPGLSWAGTAPSFRSPRVRGLFVDQAGDLPSLKPQREEPQTIQPCSLREEEGRMTSGMT